MRPGEGGGDHVGGHHPPHLHRPLLPGPRHPPGRGEVAPLDDVEVLDLGHREGPGPLLDVLGQALAALHGNQVLGLDVADGKERLNLNLKLHSAQILRGLRASHLLSVVVVMVHLRGRPDVRLEVCGLQPLLGRVFHHLLPREGDIVSVPSVHHETRPINILD